MNLLALSLKAGENSLIHGRSLVGHQNVDKRQQMAVFKSVQREKLPIHAGHGVESAVHTHKASAAQELKVVCSGKY